MRRWVGQKIEQFITYFQALVRIKSVLEIGDQENSAVKTIRGTANPDGDVSILRIEGSQSIGTNKSGGGIHIRTGIGTGNGDPGNIAFYRAVTTTSGTGGQSGMDQLLNLKGDTGYCQLLRGLDIVNTSSGVGLKLPTYPNSSTGTASTTIQDIQPSTVTANNNDTSLMTAKAIIDYVSAASIEGTAAGLSATLAVGSGGTGATTLTSNKLLTGNGTSAIQAEANLEYVAPNLTMTGSDDQNPTIILTSINTGVEESAEIRFSKNAEDSEDGEYLGKITFYGDDSADSQTIFGSIHAEISEFDNTDEAGKLTLSVAASDGTNTLVRPGLIMEGEHNTAQEVDVTIANGSASTTTVAGNLIVTTDLTVNGDTTTFTSSNADDPTVIIKNTANDNQAARLQMRKDRGAGMADNDRIGEIDFFGEDASQNTQQYGKIIVQALESDHGSETGKMTFQVAQYDGTVSDGLVVFGATSDDEIDVEIAKGAGSTTTVAGDLVVSGSDLTFDSVALTAIQTSGESFADNDTSLMTSASIQDKIQAHYSYQYLHFSFKAQNIPSDCWMSPNQVGVEYYLWNNTHGSGQTQASSGAPSAVDTSATISVDYLDQTTGFIIPKACKLEGFYGNTRLNGTNPNTLRPVMALFRAAEPSDGNTSDLTATCVAFDKYDTASGNRKNRFLKLATTVDVDLAQGDILFPACGFDATANDDAGDIWGAFTIVLKTLIP